MNNILIIDYFSLVKRYYRLDEDQDKNDFIMTYIDKILPRIVEAMIKYKPVITFVACDSGKNVRALAINSEYKGNRKKAKSISEEELMQSKIELLKIFVKTLPVIFLENKNTEADFIVYSIVNYLKETIGLENVQYIIGSSDSDFIQLFDDDVVMNNWNHPNVLITQKNFSDFFKGLDGFCWPEAYAFAKSFTGDTSDNIKGVGGFGWKTVIKLFKIIGPVSSIKELQTKVDEHLSNKKGDKSDLALLNRVKKTILGNKSKFEKLLNNQKIIDFSMLETPYFMEVNNTIEEGLSTLIEFDEKNFKKIISVDCYLDGTEDDRRVKRSFLKEIMLLKQIVSRSNKFIDQNIPYEE